MPDPVEDVLANFTPDTLREFINAASDDETFNVWNSND